jgi:hypothetical protein
MKKNKKRKYKKHTNPNCQCYTCKSHRGELKGKKHPAFIDGRTLKKYYCVDCGEEISYRSGVYGNKRCGSCSAKLRFKKEKSPMYIDGRSTKPKYCIDCGKLLSDYRATRCANCNNKKHSLRMSGKNNSMYGRKRTLKFILNHSERMKRKWKNKKYKEKMIKAILKGLRFKPNKPEKLLGKLLNKLFPKEYKINVKGKVMILGGKVPDFVNVNGQKKVIEMFGDFWHSKKWIKKHGSYENTEQEDKIF